MPREVGGRGSAGVRAQHWEEGDKEKQMQKEKKSTWGKSEDARRWRKVIKYANLGVSALIMQIPYSRFKVDTNVTAFLRSCLKIPSYPHYVLECMAITWEKSKVLGLYLYLCTANTDYHYWYFFRMGFHKYAMPRCIHTKSCFSRRDSGQSYGFVIHR